MPHYFPLSLPLQLQPWETLGKPLKYSSVCPISHPHCEEVEVGEGLVAPKASLGAVLLDLQQIKMEACPSLLYGPPQMLRRDRATQQFSFLLT